MVYDSFDQLLARTQSGPPSWLVVAAAADEHTLAAVQKASQAGLVKPVLVGDRGRLEEILKTLGVAVPDADLHHEADDAKACARAVELVRTGRGDALMKGKVDTRVLLGAVVDAKAGLRRDGLMSHIAIFETPGYHKLLTVVDGGMVAYPTVQQKKQIIINTVQALRAIGYTQPKVGVLACVEKVNPKMPQTLDADALSCMNRQGEIPGCIVNGPISYDCAVSAEIAQLKGYTGAVAGDADILLAPDIHCGNIMGKMLSCTCGARMAGIVMGAACPIVLASRGASAEEKYLSILLSAAVSRNTTNASDEGSEIHE